MLTRPSYTEEAVVETVEADLELTSSLTQVP